MVALLETEARTPRKERMELRDLDSGGAQLGGEGVGQLERAERVVQHAHADARLRALDQRCEEAPARLVVAQDVRLEMDVAPGARDRFEHRRERGASAAQRLDLDVGPQPLLAMHVGEDRRIDGELRHALAAAHPRRAVDGDPVQGGAGSCGLCVGLARS